VSQDVLGKSKGALGDLSLLVPWITEKFTMAPGIGIQVSNAKYNEYYYGVSRKESARSGVKHYKPGGDAVSPYISLAIKYNITERWQAVAMGKVEYLTKKITDSPMVGKKYAATVGAGLQFNF